MLTLEQASNQYDKCRKLRELEASLELNNTLKIMKLPEVEKEYHQATYGEHVSTWGIIL